MASEDSGVTEELLAALEAAELPEMSSANLKTLAQIEGPGDAGAVKDMVVQHQVVMFSRSRCSFCHELKRIFNEFGVQPHVVETDEVSGGEGILAAAKRLSGHKTVPIVYIQGLFLGGCDEIKALQIKGLLQDKLASAAPG